MFVRCQSVLPIPFDKAKAALQDLTAESTAVAEDGDGRADQLDRIGFELPPIQVRKKVDLRFGRPAEIADQVLTADVGWRGTGAEGLFPVWEGKLELSGHGHERTRLTVRGNYFPPLGSVGKAIDQALMNRIARASIDDFSDRLGRALVTHADA
jgi:hypothetical protein